MFRASDGVNYTQMLKELRSAIRGDGHDYIVTFTAPTSYWYLRHFHIEAMTNYVDWINLMSVSLSAAKLSGFIFLRLYPSP